MLTNERYKVIEKDKEERKCLIYNFTITKKFRPCVN